MSEEAQTHPFYQIFIECPSVVQRLNYACLHERYKTDHAVTSLRRDRRARFVIGVDVSASKTVDGLFRIAHKKQSAWPQPRIVPPRRLRFRRDKKNNRRLNTIGVLKLVDKYILVSFSKRDANGLVLGYKFMRARKRRSSKSSAAASRLRRV